MPDPSKHKRAQRKCFKLCKVLINVECYIPARADACKLLEAGFDYITDTESAKIFRRRK